MSGVKHIGNCPERRSIYNPAEMIYAKEWERKNKRQPGLNGGLGYLEMLLNPNSKRLSSFGPCSFGAKDITQRDAFVAATVIQWLGTNVGGCFIEECEKIIKEREEEFRAAQLTARRLVTDMGMNLRVQF